MLNANQNQMSRLRHYIMLTNACKDNPEELANLRTELENEFKIPAIGTDAWAAGNSERLVLLNLYNLMAELRSDALK